MEVVIRLETNAVFDPVMVNLIPSVWPKARRGNDFTRYVWHSSNSSKRSGSEGADRPKIDRRQPTIITLMLINLFHVCIYKSSVHPVPWIHGLFIRDRTVGIPTRSFFLHVFCVAFQLDKIIKVSGPRMK